MLVLGSRMDFKKNVVKSHGDPTSRWTLLSQSSGDDAGTVESLYCLGKSLRGSVAGAEQAYGKYYS